MRKFILLFISALFICNFAYAETINLHWSVDNQTYDTTTCTIGGDVTLPNAPTKRGHVFRGWAAEHFDRGIFANWLDVPKNANIYSIDIHNNRTPLTGDYMIVEDVSDYVRSFKSFVSYKVITTWDIYIDGVKLQENNVANEINGITFYFLRNGGLSCDSIMVIGGVQYSPGTIYKPYGNYSFGNVDNPITIQADDGQYKYNGTWRFVYDGVWEIDGKDGWKPDYQISSNQNE